jgi:hypothetical protein
MQFSGAHSLAPIPFDVGATRNMSILGGILDVVGAVVAVASGGTLGILAGALLAVGAAAQFGIIGGSVGKFMTSGWGEGLTAAVSMGAAAYNLVGAGAQAAQMGAAASTSATDIGAGTAALDASTDTAMAATSSAISNDVGVSMSNISALQDPATMAETAGLNPENAAAIQQASNAANGAADAAANASGTSGVGAAPGTASPTSQATIANTSQVTGQQAASVEQQAGMQDQVTGGAAPNVNTGGGVLTKGAMAPADSEAGAYPGTAPAVDPNAAPAPTGLPNGVTPAMPPYTPPTDVQQLGASVPTIPSSSGGMLSGALSGIEAHPALALAGAQTVAGIGQGMSQEKQMEQMIQAQEWGNLQWQNQSQVDQLQAAAAKPITVPQGYLSRAASVRGMMNSGGQGSPTSGVQPAAPGVPSIPISAPPTPPGMSAPSALAPAGGMV